MHNQMQPSGRMQGFGMQNADATGSGNMPSEQNNGLRSQTPNSTYASSTLTTNAAGTMHTMPTTAYSSMTGYGNLQTSANSSGGLTSTSNMSASTENTNSQQLSYDQFQEQVRQRQEQEQDMARQALLSAGADRQSDRTRAVLTQLSSLSQEIQRAENQIQVQMDAQLRQLQLIHQRVRQAESLIQETLPNMQTQIPATATLRQ